MGEDIKRTKFGSEEHRAKVSINSKRYWDSLSESEREDRRQKAKDVWTPEAKQARKDMLKSRLEDPEASAIYRANLSKGVREANLRPEVQEKRKIASQISTSDPEYRKNLTDRMNQPWNVELNAKVRGPLSQITRAFNAGKITEEEANKRREELYKIQDDIHSRYWEQEVQYLLDHPTKSKKERRQQLKKIQELKEKYSKENTNE